MPTFLYKGSPHVSTSTMKRFYSFNTRFYEDLDVMGFVARLFLSLTCKRDTILRQKIVDSSFFLSLSFFFFTVYAAKSLLSFCFSFSFLFIFPLLHIFLNLAYPSRSILFSEQYPEISNWRDDLKVTCLLNI